MADTGMGTAAKITVGGTITAPHMPITSKAAALPMVTPKATARPLLSTEAALLPLLSWLSPAFPVGGYTYSHGLEWAVEDGLVRDRATTQEWIMGVLRFGAGRNDADLFREVWQAVTEGDTARFDRAVEWAAVLRGTPELALESTQQGQSFLATVAACWPAEGLEAWRQRITVLERPPAYAVAVALATAVHGVPLASALAAFLHALSAALVSAAVRLIPLGQTDGQRVQAALASVIAEAVAASQARTWDDLGSAAPMVDLCSMTHETQYTRLFRS